MSDLIDRQAAIDAAIEAADDWDGGCNIGRQKRIEKYIGRLPSAEPEIIRCKDCKHYWIHKCMDSMPIERCDLEQTFYDAEVDYCSLAERREVTE